MTLSVADIDRWNAEAVREVFHAATARSQAANGASRELSSLSIFATWQGATRDAAVHQNATIRQDLDDHGNEALAVARAAGKAADDIDKVKGDLAKLRAMLRPRISKSMPRPAKWRLFPGCDIPLPSGRRCRKSARHCRRV
ncbi:hypothetical protein MSIMFI_01068 [Mycobacterium simulans]|uniref:hypothetical protein n=1 Tax=Mycobacterium simulans TaxID=627089 RepID=UPI00174A9E56|nr:hypothetical protein MSIMFI_01068 [Mycobacterium simulans]